MDNISEKLKDKINNGREYRKILLPFEARALSDNADSRIVEGYATKFNEEYLLFDLGTYRVFEQIDPHAFDECDMSDVIMQYDHEGRVFARTSNGTLELSIDNIGLHVRADLGGTEIGRQLYEEIKGGYTNKMSFGFVVAEDERLVRDLENNITEVHRTITKIKKLYDVSAVSIPANDATEISARAFGEGVIAEAKAERERVEKKTAQRIAQIKRIKLLLEV